jgi:hypothetical protein
VDGSSSRETTPVPRPRRRAPVDRGAVRASSHTVAARESRRPGVGILRRVRLAGYRGGKSALYELVRRLRLQRPVNRASSS